MSRVASSQPLPRILVVGLGNPLRGDDALGPIVAERIGHAVDSPSVTVISRNVLTPEIAADAAAADLVVFVDASLEGEVGAPCVTRVVPGRRPTTMAHTLQFADILAYSRQLYGRSPECYLVTALGVAFDLSDGKFTSPEAEAAVRPMTTAAAALIQQRLAEHSAGMRAAAQDQ